MQGYRIRQFIIDLKGMTVYRKMNGRKNRRGRNSILPLDVFPGILF
jgi:hypothetical protein